MWQRRELLMLMSQTDALKNSFPTNTSRILTVLLHCMLLKYLTAISNQSGSCINTVKKQNKKILNYTKGILCEENSDRCPRQCKRESTQLGMMQAKTISEHAEETSWPNTRWMETSSLCSSLIHLCLSWVTLVKSPRLRQEVLLPPLLIGRERFSLHTENFSPESDEGSFNLQHQPFHKRGPWLSETQSSCGTHCTPRSSKKKDKWHHERILQ